ncbi:MAG: MBL fold metallo-hydrolase [Candidatus Eiseniibacteriota bacterium]
MRRAYRTTFAALVLLLPPVAPPVFGATAPSAAAAAAPAYGVQRLADGVFAVVRREPLGLANHSNTLLVIGDRDVLVVDTPFTLEATRAVIGELRKLTKKPVRAVVNTHWHDDHTFGNQVYRDSFPNAEFIAHEHTAEDMASVGVENRKTQVEGGALGLADIRRAIERDTSFTGLPMTGDERASYASTLAIAETYLAEVPEFRITLPTRTFARLLTLEQGKRKVEIRWFGRGNTRGDAVVFLPKERVLAAGDLVNVPVPVAGASFLGEWIAALDSLRALGPLVIVPGHGPVLEGDAQIVATARLLSSVKQQTDAAVARGESLEQALSSVRLDEHRTAIAGGNRMVEYFFDGWFAMPAIMGEFKAARSVKKPVSGGE